MRDARLHNHPRVITRGEKMRLSTKILTAAGLTAALYLWWLPVRSVARAILFVLGGWAGGAYAGFWPYPDDLPFNWKSVAIAAVTTLVLWLTERATNFPLTRLAIGKRLVISITPDTMRVACGFFRESFPRTQRLAFVHVPFSTAESPVYRNSQLLAIIVGDAKRTRIAECVDLKRIARIVSNANVSIALAHQADDHDIDPVTLRLARARR
ncbi:MAG: hypothetical protein ACREF9_13870 [Opitutaceae bacterium]